MNAVYNNKNNDNNDNNNNLNENRCQPKEKYEKNMHEILFSSGKRLKI